MNAMTTEAKGELAALADELAMFASQVKESSEGHGDPVNPWHLDDWLARYRATLEKTP